jgi:hypothetical protein
MQLFGTSGACYQSKWKKSASVTASRRSIETTKKTACTCIANVDVVSGQPDVGLAEIN